MRKIVFLDHYLNGGGAERVVATIIRMLSHQNIEIHLILTAKLGQLKFLIPENVIVHELNATSSKFALLRYIRTINKIKPNIVFSSLRRTSLIALISRYFTTNHRIIVRYPSMPFREQEEGWLTGPEKHLSRLFYPKADIVIAQTIEMKNELIFIFKIDPSLVKVLFNPIDENYIKRFANENGNPYNVLEKNIVASGRIGYLKGFDILLKAFVSVIKRYPKIKLNILGSDTYNEKQELIHFCEKNNLLDNVVFHGFIENPYPYYKYADLFVLSSRLEGMPNTIIESLLLGTPVVATRCVPIVDRIIDINNGFVVDINDSNEMCEKINEAIGNEYDFKYIVESNESWLKLFKDNKCK